MPRPDMSKRADLVAGMFGRVARGYDRTNTVLSGGIDHLWRAATVTAIAPKSGERVLDIAAGTGASSIAIAKKGAEVTGLDFSAGMIEEGRRRHPSIRFVEGDAEKLPFDDDSFDAVTISFGLRNVEHPQTALEEMLRVLVPGGRVVICEFSTPPRALLCAGYDLYLRRGLPLVAKAVSSDPEAYLYLGESIDGWADQDVLAGWMRGVGFTRVAYRNLTGGIVALHRGRKPTDPGVLASSARRRARRRAEPS